MRKETYDNIAVFKDTIKMCKENKDLVSNIEVSKECQKVFHENDPVIRYIHATSNNRPVNITVTADRTLNAARKYKDRSNRTAVLNFADFYNPGGLVEYGSRAQEESLCRISTLYPCLTDRRMMDEFYVPHKIECFDSLYNSDIIYTPNVGVFKNDGVEMDVLDREDWYVVDVITCAAPNLRSITISKDSLYEIQKSRFSRILAVANHNGVDNLVLGAFGCGAFRNDPEVVARAAKDAIKEYYSEGRPTFKNIEFAVYCTAADTSNYIAFKECFDDPSLDKIREGIDSIKTRNERFEEAGIESDAGDEEERARSFTSNNFVLGIEDSCDRMIRFTHHFEERSERTSEASPTEPDEFRSLGYDEEDFEYDSTDGEVSDFEYDPFD